MGGTERWRGLLAPLAVAVGMGVLGFVWLERLNPAFVVTDDGIRDQLLARDCSDLGRCHLIGAPTSLPGIHQGAAWLDMLVAARVLGGDSDTQRVAVLALLALGLATACIVVWRWLRPSFALPTAILLLLALSLDRDPSLLINPSAAAFPDLLAAAGMLCYALSARRRFLAAAAFAVGVGINVHVGAASLVPALLAVAALVHPRPLRAAAAVLAVVLAICLLTSSAALLANLRALTAQGRIGWLLAGALAAALSARGASGLFRRASWAARAWIVGALLIAPFGLAALWLALAQRHHFSLAYLHPIIAPAAAMAAAALALPWERAATRRAALRWVPSAGALAVLAALAAWRPAAFAPHIVGPSWSMAEAARIAAAAARRGWTYEDLRMRLQGNGCHQLLTAMSVAAPPPAAAPAERPRRQLQVVRVAADMPRPTEPHEIVRLGPDSVAVLRDVDSWMRPESAQACRLAAGAAAPACAGVALDAGDVRDPRQFLFSMRAYPDVHGLDVERPYLATYQIPLLPDEGGRRELMLAADAAAGGWRIAGVEGVQIDGALPAVRVGLYSGNGHPGLLIVERRFGGADGDPSEIDVRAPPCLFEAPAGDPLAAIVGAR